MNIRWSDGAFFIDCDRCTASICVTGWDATGWTRKDGVDRCPDCTDRLAASRTAARAWREAWRPSGVVTGLPAARWWVAKRDGIWFTSPPVGTAYNDDHRSHAEAIAHADRMAREGRR